MRWYAGIGSRQTPEEILKYMRHMAHRIGNVRWGLRSGGAVGADMAFEDGAKKYEFIVEILRPNDATEKSIAVAATFHPAWHLCNAYTRKLHGRNAQIILGPDLTVPVELVICWTAAPLNRGGTRLGIAIAEKHGIPVFNLNKDEIKDKLEDWLEDHGV